MNIEEQLEEIKRGIIIREATALDMPEVARVFGIARRKALPYLPQLHTQQEDIDYFSNSVFLNNQVYVAVAGSHLDIVDKRNVDKRIVGFIAFDNEWVHHLYLLPEHQNMGIGASLLKLAKERSSRLQLWVFQNNKRALAFYSRHGFTVLRQTDGLENEEKEPDALLEWS